MNRKARALIAASSLAMTVGAANAQNLDQAVSEAIDLPALADLILMELLGTDDPLAAEEAFALALGFNFGVAFSSENTAFADALAEGLVITSGPDSAGFVDALSEALAAPGLAAVNSGLQVAATTPAPYVGSANPISPD